MGCKSFQLRLTESRVKQSPLCYSSSGGSDIRLEDGYGVVVEEGINELGLEFCAVAVSGFGAGDG